MMEKKKSKNMNTFANTIDWSANGQSEKSDLFFRGNITSILLVKKSQQSKSI